MSHTRARAPAPAGARPPGLTGWWAGCSVRGQGGLPLQRALALGPPLPNVWARSALAPCSLVPVANRKTWGLRHSLYLQKRKLRSSRGAAGWTQVERGWDSMETDGFCLILRPLFFSGRTGPANGSGECWGVLLSPPFAPPFLTSQHTCTTMCIHTHTGTLTHSLTHMSCSDRRCYCLVAGVTEVFSRVLLQSGDEPLVPGSEMSFTFVISLNPLCHPGSEDQRSHFSDENTEPQQKARGRPPSS